MEAQVKKRTRKKVSTTSRVTLEESVPEAPLLEDFDNIRLNELSMGEIYEGEHKNGELASHRESENVSEVDLVLGTTTGELKSEAEGVILSNASVNTENVASSEAPLPLAGDHRIATASFDGTLMSPAAAVDLEVLKSCQTKILPQQIKIYPSLTVGILPEFEHEEDLKYVDPCEEALPTAPDNLNLELTDLYNVPATVSRLCEKERSILENVSEVPKVLLRPRPFTASEIMSLYDNYLLENREDNIQQFLNSVKYCYKGFELYELLCNYLRNCNQLTTCEKSLSSLRDQSDNHEKNVWRVTSENVPQNAVCADKNNVVATHTYHVSAFESSVFNQLNRNLKEIKELIKDSFSLYTYSVQLCKAQINNFFYKSFNNINLQSFEVQGYTAGYPTRDIQICAQLLKTCISVLFIFARKPVPNLMFSLDIQTWLGNSVSLLQRMATLEDNLFVVNHVVRCPSGAVAKWAAPFIQVPPIPIPVSASAYSASFAHLNLDYALVVLATILNPVSKRDEFLKHYQADISTVVSHSESNHQWVLVDSDGEDDPEDVSFFKESDLIAMLQQVPFDRIFRRVLFVYRKDEEDEYEIRLTSDHGVLKLLAFSSQLVDILGGGLVCYYTDRYRQLVKLLGRLMLHTAQYVTEHVENFLNEPHARDMEETITLEYDSFFMRTVSILSSGKNVGTLQFLAAMPFHFVSSNMLWEIYNILTKWDVFDANSGRNDNISGEFENELISMSESDGFYLLTTLSNMAIAREGKDADFVRIVTLHLFQIGFLSPLTKDSCSKNGRDLLSSLTHKYPVLISVLMHTIKPKMDILEKMSLFLLKELAFNHWKPEEMDIILLSHWLLNFPVTAVENQISRFIIQSMNWDFDHNGELFLPYELHLKVALLVVELQCKWEKNQNILTESVKQVTRTTDGYLLWGWEITNRLHLHFFDRCNKYTMGLTEVLRRLPSFETNSELEPLRKAVEENNPLGCLMALLITPLGHSLPLLCSSGFDLLETLVRHSKYESVINILFFLTPLFIGCRDLLYKHEKFRIIVNALLGADLTYVRMAKNLIVTEFPGRYTNMLGNMISAQLHQCERLRTTEKRLVRLWTEVLTKIDNWNKDNNIIYLLDVLTKYSFSRSDCRFFIKEHFLSLYKEIPSSSQSGLAFLFSWSPTTTTLLPSPSYPQMPYFLNLILTLEMEMENSTGFWKSVCSLLGNPKCSLDTAVKKSCSSSKFLTTTNLLTIYRYAQLALDLPVDHELGLLIWQKFFLRFLHRIHSTQYNRDGVGERFFEGMVNTAFLKRLKKRLHELVSFYNEKVGVTESNISGCDSNLSVNPELLLNFYRTSLKLAIAFTLWIEDQQIHKESLYPPALPPQYLPDRLVNLIDGDTTDWIDSVDYDAVLQSEKTAAVSYISFITRQCWIEAPKMIRVFNWNSSSNRKEELLKRLRTYDQPLKPPPVPIFNQVLPVATADMFVSVQSMTEALKPHLSILKEFAESFSMRISQHTALDCFYCEILPELYSNVKTEVLVNARCGGAKKWKSCSGPAHVVFKFSEARLNERIGLQIQQNRMEYQALISNQGIQPPNEMVCIAAVFVEDFITNIILLSRNCAAQDQNRNKMRFVGIELFYIIVDMLCPETEFYLPTRQLFSSFLEVIGQEFITSDPSQCKRLITMCMKNPKLVESLAPHINLAKTPTSLLLDVYERVVNIPDKDADLAFVILTKFDIASWLKTTKPKLHERSLLISHIWKALTTESRTSEMSSLMVHDTYRKHLKIMLLHDFPQHYGEILNYLLLGCEKQCVPLSVWYDFFNSLSRDMIKFRPGMDSCTRKREAKRFATEADVIQHQELIETSQLLASHFTKERLSYGIYGLYPKYRCYIDPLSCFIQIISHTVVASSLRNSKGMLSHKIVEAIWPIIRDIYSPWIMPYNQQIIQQHCSQWIQQMNFDAASVLHPWISTDSPLAMVYINDFTDCVMFLAETLPGASILFSYLWNFYAENYAQPGVKDHVLHVVHQCFITIPWAMFWPTVSDLEVMNKVAEKYLPACHNFIGVVFAQIDWSNWIHNLLAGNQHNTALVCKAHSIVLNLTVRLANDCVARESPSWVSVMEKSKSIKWQYISLSALEPILNWYVMSVDPRVVLRLETVHRMDIASLKVLKSASGYWNPGENDTDTKSFKGNLFEYNKKRYLFVRLYVRLLVTVSAKHKNLIEKHGKYFEKAVRDMIDDIVCVVKKFKHEDCSLQIQELISLMSHHYLGTITRNGIIEWCEINKDAPLNFLYCIIQLSFSAKVHPYLSAPLIETCTRLCFQYPESTWEAISGVSSTIHDHGELANYFDVAAKDGHYLTLYCLLMTRYNHMCKGEFSTVTFLSDLLRNLKPKESNEAALPLIYSLIIKISLEVLQTASETVTINMKKFLNNFIQHLASVADDKQGWGLLGALGLGKVSQLSVRGRLFVRCLSLFLMVQMPINVPIRMKTPAVGHYLEAESDSQSRSSKPHGDLLQGIEKLEALKLNRQYNDLLECIDYTTDFMKDSNNCLLDAVAFIERLSFYLFTEPFLVRRAINE